ncbi:hypothetical protein GPL17_32515 [Bradyrhizobium yuanmingense]|uniref:hypothetical protein n=1 Tax=Bradyrhizobium TaxID=374 RepID=UPI000FE315A9|nr:hypothetical protein [Bradyrhizobium yuanmingense]MDF0579825.1 hypothetical protein [Bradyrhizobium yuanmingense]MVT55165.1 hypothetical protein [Bradyrhizobium yuanmingense]TGN90550.1 hypothetical protein EOW77_0001530 [Bradyrhizobium yuanmingense]
MIKDRAFSARGETTRKTLRRLAALAVGAGLSLVPFAAFGAESAGPAAKTADSFERLALPPIPYLDTMPWSSWDRGGPTMKVDTLLPVLGPSGIRLDLTPPDRDRPEPATS